MGEEVGRLDRGTDGLYRRVGVMGIEHEHTLRDSACMLSYNPVTDNLSICNHFQTSSVRVAPENNPQLPSLSFSLSPPFPSTRIFTIINTPSYLIPLTLIFRTKRNLIIRHIDTLVVIVLRVILPNGRRTSAICVLIYGLYPPKRLTFATLNLCG